MLVHRRGHNFLSTGARHFIDEVTECDKINKAINKYLDILGVNYTDATPGKLPTTKDLAYGVDIANKLKADLFFSIHMNSSNSISVAPRGCEVITFKEELPQAMRVLEGLEKLGFKNRGIKHSEGLYELRKTNCKAMIIEVCFVNSFEDVNIYKNVGPVKIARAIVEGVTGRTLPKERKICPLCGHNQEV